LRYPVFAVESFQQFSAFYDFKAATAAAVPLALVAFCLLLAEALVFRKKGNLLRPRVVANEPSPCRFSGRQKGLLGVVSAFGFVVVLCPLLALVVQAGGWDAYAEAFRRAGDSLARSLVYAASGATLLVFFGFFIGYLIQSKVFRLGPVVDFLILLLFVLPGSVIGIGLIGLWNTPQTNWIYGTPWILLFGYLAKYTALSSRITIAQLDRIPPSMEEAAQAAGAGWFRRMGAIILPLAWRGWAVSWLVGYLFALRDTDIAMLVYPPGCDPLPVRIFTLMANGSPRLIAALCVIMVAVTLVPLGLAGILFLKKKELK
jgi:iron(III) transport system permease protein